MPDSLCEQCSKIPFRPFFQGTGYRHYYSDNEIALGTLERIWAECFCHFCGLIKHTLGIHYGKNSVEKLLRSNVTPTVFMYCVPLDQAYDGFQRPIQDISHYVDFGLYGISKDASAAFYAEGLARIGFAVRSNPQVIALRDIDATESSQPMHFGRTVDPSEIEWSMIKDWIASCLSKHHNTKLTSAGYDSQQPHQLELRVIDVSQSCIVTIPPRTQYVALSYVWGRDQALKLKRNNLTLLSAEGCFDSEGLRPSRTIMDGMRVVQQLGYRYLWVDALCIIQDDAENIQANITRMGQIYSEAFFTIAAAAGTDADFGLPGVSPECPRSLKQKSVTVQGLTIANRLHPNVDYTYWNKRGWTYQERMLSPRLLTFTPSHITYRCDMGCNQDEQFYTHDGAHFTAIDMTFKLQFEAHNIFEVYAIAVTQYTKRVITNPMDKIKAFEGVLDLLRHPFESPFFFGLPVSMFHMGLLWMPLGRCRRGDKRFPSWSWAGWEGAVAYDYHETDSNPNLCERTISQCTIRIDKTNIDLSYSSEPRTGNASCTENEDRWTRHFDEETCEVYYKDSKRESQLYRYPRPLSIVGQETWRLLAKGVTPILRIQGRVAKFRLTGQHSEVVDISDAAKSCKKGQHKQCNLAILDSKGRAAGRVRVDAYTLPKLQNQEHKFLALSRSTLYFHDDVSWDEESKAFRSWVDAPAGGEVRRQEEEYEEYHKPFAEWTAEAPSELDDGHPLLSELLPEIDRSGVYKDDYDGLQENSCSFDAKHYSDKVFWPILNVLLLFEKRGGIVERCGIGQIHVDAFYAIDNEEPILLG
ncbi:heterokaryon incompatibility protein-domain-containing protein [Hypoxylon rubiginosum]|uniref:Heterokaryon incompatibility protein-domain-containing protein n=1 Tax=Hypoxylon rubiginosum TaxID=110542 RepID=A0ACC0D5K9_9PEZI|nr:heterokaryon incompatibility protein-domain-containing protein [Hypoxylon rubiginosum]